MFGHSTLERWREVDGKLVEVGTFGKRQGFADQPSQALVERVIEPFDSASE